MAAATRLLDKETFLLGTFASNCSGGMTVTKRDSLLFKDVPEQSIVWMSHTDRVDRLPAGFEVSARTEKCPVAAMENAAERLNNMSQPAPSLVELVAES